MFDPLHDLCGRRNRNFGDGFFTGKVKETQYTVKLERSTENTLCTGVPVGANELQPPPCFTADITWQIEKGAAVDVLKILIRIPFEDDEVDPQPFKDGEFIPVGRSGGDDEQVPGTGTVLQIFPQMECHAPFKNIKEFVGS